MTRQRAEKPLFHYFSLSTPNNSVRKTMSPIQEPSVPALTEMDQRGDVVFVVGTAVDNTPARSFRVCSRTMARISPVFDRMLHGSFAESKPTAPSSDLISLSSSGINGTTTSPAKDWIVHLRDDRPDSFDLLASIAHSQFQRIPRALSIAKLYELTVLTHYYDATPVLSPWLQTWVSGIAESPETTSSSIAGPEGELLMPKLLWISWELGHKQLFESTARRMVMESSGNLFGDESGLGDLSMPPDVIERIAAIRTQTIQSIIDVFSTLAVSIPITG
ncbi:uncharacterized protein CLUP02_11280 [Colletotrichum lupini]|uniref:BTB domain-containing protein n=1 Tax=Colletotrichum lupini TaxID=145971 RepID=A0A9Q8SZZ0_9PEZI|nr:uncharacterized protein CLUP02_11280 [Colletotrichum lupini]UQC85781.1 hypothetical protein CLUP02_11280 [Colletotrichum lupini]